MRPVALLAAAGFVGVVLSKLLFMLMLPLLGMFVGFVVFVLKALLIVGLVWVAFQLFRKLTDRPSDA